MKINIRLLLLTFTIVVLVTVTSSLIYFSLTNQIITTSQNQSILNSTSDFIFNYELTVDNLEADFKRIINRSEGINNAAFNEEYIDFIFTLENDELIDFNNYYANDNLNIRSKKLSLKQFLSDNSNLILRYEIMEDNIYYYGKVVTEELLNSISTKIRADLALVVNQTPSEISNSTVNQTYLSSVIDAVKNLRFKNQYDIFKKNYGDYDFYATYYLPGDLVTADYKLGFLIYSTPKDVVEFRYTSGVIALIIILVGIALALIFVMLFTSKLRDQISKLSYAAEVTGKGNLNYRVPIETNDELGKLAQAFNNMLDQLKSQKEVEKEYTDFITLLNQKPTLKEISEAAIQKIIKSTGISFGVLYLVEESDNLKRIASYGIKEGINEQEKNFDYYKNAIEQKDIIEFKYKKNLPIVRTGISEIRIKYIVILPIIYSNEVVAIIELASEEIPEKDIKRYLLSIREQLAIGIMNGSSFEQLQKLVNDLRSLNEDYQTQNRELRDVQAELEKKAEQLDQERVRALESTKLKSQFLTNITHELKTPLNSVIGLSGLLKNDSDTPHNHLYRLDVIIRNSKKLLNLINNILEFSKAEAGKSTVKLETFSLGEFLNDINSIEQPYASEKGLSYLCEAPNDHDVPLHTDRAKLEQILINLLNNSIKFTEEGFVKLDVTLQPDKGIKFCVSDTGIGIDLSDQDSIFEEFRQADGTLSRQYDGTGLGLSICKKFVELLNGEFDLQSEVGKGSKFIVELRNVVIDTTQKMGDVSSKAIKSQKRFMILDENKTNKKLIGDYLKLNGFNQVEHYSNTGLPNFIEENSIECVIINQNYDGKNGWKIIHDITSNIVETDLIVIPIATSEESNCGYGIGISQFLIESKIDEQIIPALENLKKNTESENLRVVTCSKFADLNEILLKKYKSTVLDQTLLNSTEGLDGNLLASDVIILDLHSKKSIATVDQLKHNRQTRSIPIIGLLPETFDSNIEKLLTVELNNVLLKHKHHLLDVLKIFRDRLNIAENELAKAKLFKEDEYLEDSTEIRNEGEDTILIVDDDRDTLYTVGEIVKSTGLKPIFAKNGVECILTLKSEIPELILLDIMMPKMDGFETLKEIKKHKEYRDIPVLAITAYAMLDDKDIIERSGFDDIITKPIDSTIILTKLNEYFKTEKNRMSKICVIDDHPENVFILQDRLERAGFEVITAYDGKSGLEKIKEEVPDLVLLDVMMPDVSGFEVCKSISTDDSIKHIPVIMLTALTSTEDLEEGLQAGAYDYVRKPFNRAELLARIKSALRFSETNKFLIDVEKMNTYSATVLTANHEIKQPLTLINLSTTAIKRELSKEELNMESLNKRIKYIEGATKEIIEVLEKLTNIKKPAFTDYINNLKMIDINTDLSKNS